MGAIVAKHDHLLKIRFGFVRNEKTNKPWLMFSPMMGKRLFLRPKDNLSYFELDFVSLLIYFRLLNCDRVMICPGFLWRVLSLHFYSTYFFKRVNLQSNLFKKLQLLNNKANEELS